MLNGFGKKREEVQLNLLLILPTARRLNDPMSIAVPIGVIEGTGAAGGADGAPGSLIIPFVAPSLSPIPPSCSIMVMVLSPSLLPIGIWYHSPDDALYFQYWAVVGISCGKLIVTFTVSPFDSPVMLKLKIPCGKSTFGFSSGRSDSFKAVRSSIVPESDAKYAVPVLVAVSMATGSRTVTVVLSTSSFPSLSVILRPIFPEYALSHVFDGIAPVASSKSPSSSRSHS